MTNDPPDWETLETHDIRWSRVFGVQDVTRRSPRTGRVGTYQVIHSAPWCNVVALTPDDELRIDPPVSSWRGVPMPRNTGRLGGPWRVS